MEMRYDTNCIPYITAYGDENDRCDMSSHKLYGRGIRPSSCMRSKSKGGGGGGMSGGRQQNGNQDGNEEENGDRQQQQQRSGGGGSEASVADEACKMFAKLCFQHYTKPFCECAMITEGEFGNCMDEFSRMTTKFAQFFGDLPFFGKHRTVMLNLGVPNVPAAFYDLSPKQVFEQGQPIIRARYGRVNVCVCVFGNVYSTMLSWRGSRPSSIELKAKASGFAGLS